MRPAGRRLGTWTTRSLFVALTAIIMLFSVTSCGGGAGSPAAANRPAPGAPGATPPVALSPITGEPVEKPGSPVAVSIDNYKLARLQSGLADADLVYEVLTEGGITRYLAIFYGKAPSVVGPVRSARPYFALLAKEWGAVFGHCGGDPKDIQPIRDWGVSDGDEFKNTSLYWRDNGGVAPHNLYTSVDNLRKVPAQPLPAPAKRYEFQDCSDKPAAGLEIRYGRSYAVQYKLAGKSYERVVLDGDLEPLTYLDKETKEKIRVSNVIVQWAKTEVAYSDGGLIIDLIGQGKAVFLLGGRYSEGIWRKEGVETPTLFYDAGGDKITLAKGQTWVQIVPDDAQVTIIEGK